MAWLALGNAVWRRRGSGGHVLRRPTLGREIGGDLAKILLCKAFCYWRHDRVVTIAAPVIVQLLDEVALLLSDATGEAGFDAVLGLAADAVGLGEAPAAREHLAAATALAGAHPEWWRQRVRLGWVQAEVALLEGRPADAVASAAASVDQAEHAGAPRHVAKGLLFQGVSLVEAGRHDEAASILRRAGLLAESLGTLPLLWPARAVLGALVGEGDPQEGERCFQSARRTVELMAADLPETLRADWFARPDVAALLAE